MQAACRALGVPLAVLVAVLDGGPVVLGDPDGGPDQGVRCGVPVLGGQRAGHGEAPVPLGPVGGRDDAGGRR